MRTEGVFGRIQSGSAVLTAVDTDGDEAAQRLQERYAPPEPPPASLEDAKTLQEFAQAFSYRKHLDNLAGDLRTAHGQLSMAEDEHQRKLALIAELGGRRDELNQELVAVFVKVRGTLESLFGSRRGFVLANVSGNSPREPRRLLQQVGQTMSFLRNPAVDLPSHGLKGAKIDLAELANDLKPSYDALTLVLEGLDRTTKESHGTLAARNRATTEFDDIFGWVAGSFESLFHLAGLHELAERVRPSRRRRGRRAVDEENAPPAEESASEESTSEESTSEESAPAVES